MSADNIRSQRGYPAGRNRWRASRRPWMWGHHSSL